MRIKNSGKASIIFQFFICISFIVYNHPHALAGSRVTLKDEKEITSKTPTIIIKKDCELKFILRARSRKFKNTPGVAVNWVAIAFGGTGGGPGTITPSSSTTGFDGRTTVTYKAPDIKGFSYDALSAEATCFSLGGKPPTISFVGRDLKILGDPPVPLFGAFDDYLGTVLPYLKSRIKQTPSDPQMQELKKTLEILDGNADIHPYSSTSACGATTTSPPYQIKINGSDATCLADLDEFFKTLLHEARHLQCRVEASDGTQPDLDHTGIADICEPKIHDHAEIYALDHIPAGCP